jgi:branched-chain amino acid transport system substrate-binding protein
MHKYLPLVPLLLAGQAHAANEVVKIAHVSLITGPSAHIAKDVENGARLAVEDLNAKGFMINGKKVDFVLMAEDDAGDPKQAGPVAQKIVDAKVNGVVGHGTSGTSVVAAKIYAEAGIPQIAPTTTSPQYTRLGYPTAFRVVADDSKLGATLGRYAINTSKARRIAVIDDRSAYGQGVADEFVKGAKAALPGVQIVSREFTTSNAVDFTSILTTIKGKKPDLVFYGGMDAVGGGILRQMKALGINAKFMGGDGVCTEGLPKLAGEGIGEGTTICAEAGGLTPEMEKRMADFRVRFKQRFKADVQIYAPYGYDAVMVLAQAMQNAKSAAPAKYLPELKKIKYDGNIGTIAFDEKGDLKNGALTLFTYQGGKRVKLDVVR